jgi:hypothetical protein
MCPTVSEEYTAAFFRLTKSGSLGCRSYWKEGNVSVIVKLEKIWPIRAIGAGEEQR